MEAHARAGPEDEEKSGERPSAPAPTPDALPKRFGKYTLIRKLAQGGMAELFLALQRSMAGFEKLIVVKRILPELAEDKSFIEMLLAEARIAATLNHPNVAHIYDVGVYEDQYFIAMEHVHGEDLRSIARQRKEAGGGAFPVEHALAIALGCCAGLAYAHDKTDLDGHPLRIVHRDVSPQNILVTFTGDVKLVDFGVAVATTAPEQRGSLKGKFGYMSPEQVRGEQLDARSDVFALGIVLFELLTRRRLFRGADPKETLRKVLYDDVPLMAAMGVEVPTRVEMIVRKALERDREKRYPSARAMQADIEELIREQRLAVSSLSLGKFMQDLFEEKLAQQKKMLQEGRQLAEVLTAYGDDRSVGATSMSTSIRSLSPPPPAPGAPWYVVAGVALAAIGIAAVAALTVNAPEPRTEPPATIAAAAEPPPAPAPGMLTIRTTPSGARVLLDGRDTERTTPASIAGIDPGEHVVVVSFDGFEPHTERFTVASGEASNVAVELVQEQTAQAVLGLSITPRDAMVTIDGRPVPAAELESLRLAPGGHDVTISRTGFRTEERHLELRPAETARIEVVLARAAAGTVARPNGSQETAVNAPLATGPGALTFNSRPWCNVSIDGADVGQTPIVNRPLPPGPHRVVCTNPELGVSRTVNVTIRPGETTRQTTTLE